MSSVPKGTVGRTRKERQIQRIDRPLANRPAFVAGYQKQKSAIAVRKAPKPVTAKRIKAAAPANTVANKTGQSKTLNKFNSRPERTRGAYVGGRYMPKEKLAGRQPLDMGYGSDRAYGRVATKTARKRAASRAAATKQVAAKPMDQKTRLTNAAARRNAQADRIDAKIAALEKQYRSKDAAFYTQGVKPVGRDRMIAKSQQAAILREKSAQIRTKAKNAERMAAKIKEKPAKAAGENARLARAIRNEAQGSTNYRRNPKGYQKRITALTAQQIYQTGDIMAGLSVEQSSRKGFRLPRNQRRG